MLAIGTKVYIHYPLTQNERRMGVIYDYLPSRRWPYHVRPDGWSESEAGIAYTEEELEVVTTVESTLTVVDPPE